jgi:carboxylesterase type B
MGHGASIMHHLTMDQQRWQRPYFKQAILQSPAFFPSPNRTQLDQTYSQFLTSTGAKNLEELFKANTTELMQANADLIYRKFLYTKYILLRPALTYPLLLAGSSYGTFTFGPTVDGYLVRQWPGKALNEDSWRVPVMVGHTKYDALFFTPPWIRTDAQLREHILNIYPGAPPTVLDEIKTKYPLNGIFNVKEKLLQVASFLNVSQCTYSFG